jgi:zinc/manganese transport system ATP-binding protein
MGTRLTIQDLSVAYERQLAIQDIAYTVEPGDLTAIIGPNGAGKSTLLKAIAGFVRPVQGRITCAPENATVAYLPQLAEIERDFPITVFDAVLLGRWRRIGWFRAADQADREAVEAALASVGLSAFAGRGVGTLSVGQFQRMLFARLMLQDAPLILLDEPFAAVDQRTVRDLTQIILGWQAEGRTVLAVLHDLDQVAREFPRTILLARRLIAGGPTATTLTPEHLQAAAAMADE